MKIHHLLPILLSATLSSSIAQDVPPPNTNDILKELDQVDSVAKNQVASRRSIALGKIQPASSSTTSAVEFYLQALDATKYGEKHADYLEWRKKNAEFLRSPQFGTAAQLQLRYLILALQRSDKNNALAQIPLCLAYLNDLSAAHTGLFTLNQKAPKTNSSPANEKAVQEANSLVKQSLNECAVVKWLQIDDLLPDGKDFSPSPGSYEQILDKNVRGPMRAVNDSRLPGTWDLQMNFGAAKATAGGSQQDADEFNASHLPDLLYKKAQDTAAIGQPNRAIGELMALIHRYPNDPDIKDWVKTARDLLGKMAAAPVTAAPATTGTNSPASTPVSATNPATNPTTAPQTAHP